MKPEPADFPPANRLRVKADFDRVFTRPNHRVNQGVLQAIYKPSILSAGPRLGLIVAKRFLPLAVQRNRVKRLVREAFRAHKHVLPPIDIIVRLTKKPAQDLTSRDLQALFEKLTPAK